MKFGNLAKLSIGIISIIICIMIGAKVGLLSHISKDSISIPTIPPPDPTVVFQIETTIKKAISENQEMTLAYVLFQNGIENIQVSPDGNWAIAWLIPLDPETGQPVPTEPGLVILENKGGEWYVYLPGDKGWADKLQKTPAILLPQELKEYWIEVGVRHERESAQLSPFGGYYLPWAGGETLFLTQSLKHDAYTPSGNAHYAFDFAKAGSPSPMFNIHAAKSGIVYKAAWSYSNGNPSYTNLLVLEDTSTTPTTYQLYMHLAKDSIPPDLRVKGTHVAQGQFIGIADDTGASTGNHLHFHVHTNPASYWGRAVDITFRDVFINGGRPRNKGDLAYCRNDNTFNDVCEQTSYSYVSGNFLNLDQTPPTGGFTAPVHGGTVDVQTLRIEGWAADDDSGLESAQVLANFSGKWNPVGNPSTTGNFSFDWNLCSAQVPDGPLSLALELKDQAGNVTSGLPGLIHLIKNYQCNQPAPACKPGDNEIAIFSDADFHGDCTVLSLANHTSPGSWGFVGDNNIESVLVGNRVQTSLFYNNNLTGRGETLANSDSNLSDNYIGSNAISSITVQSKQTIPGVPSLVSPEPSASHTNNDSFTMYWENTNASLEYQVEVEYSNKTKYVGAWQKTPFWHVNTISPDYYRWRVRARNSYAIGGWSAYRNLNVKATGDQQPSLNTPYFDDMENSATNWSATTQWRTTNENNHTSSGKTSWSYSLNSNSGYESGSPNSGHLTSPTIKIPAGEKFDLRFWYFYETEGMGENWDQRLVQVSSDGGSFKTILQLSDDLPNTWHQSPPISLAAYAGHSIKVRFYFATLDNIQNHFKGWFVDDVSVDRSTAPNCFDSGNTYVQAEQIYYSTPKEGDICPAGDIDFYKFSGNTGDRIVVKLQKISGSETFQPGISLLDGDGKSELAKFEYQIKSGEDQPIIAYYIYRTGVYYLKVKSVNHPAGGNLDSLYQIQVIKDAEKPSAAFSSPREGQSIGKKNINLTINASDTISGVDKVEFYWHSADWETTDWNYLGTDTNGSDGWNFNFDASQLEKLDGIAFFGKVFDKAGNTAGTGVWNLKKPAYIFPLIFSSP